ncbi:hypothetical protein IB270_07645 [Ensifer sp. ENS05]|uniref:hypothetical protein n=1 Tax=Ensifer sp. ENS05 TaxID=2769277 RepID=UPI0017841AE4|nr:hypothetical protein [Ensifer sp. ENS05]MBD9592702.1 hypothetical protein [Ensifer sp. ENS05]
MSRILNVSRNDDGQFEIVDAGGKAVAGPFDTNAAAWNALDRLDNEDHAPARAKSNKKLLWGKPERPKSKKAKRQEKKQIERQERQMKVNAATAPGWIRAVAAKTFDPAGERKHRDHKLGTFGPASEVRKIDPAVYLAEKAARGEL